MIKLSNLVEIKNVNPSSKYEAFNYFKIASLYFLFIIIDGINKGYNYNSLVKSEGYDNYEEWLREDYGWEVENLKTAVDQVKFLFLFKPDEIMMERFSTQDPEIIPKTDISQYKFMEIIEENGEDYFIILNNF